MKLVKCKKCGSTVMTSETLLTTMQEEYNSLIKKSQRAKGSDKQIITQQLSHIKKMMVAVCHSNSEMETRKNVAYNEVLLLKKYLVENNIVPQEMLDNIQSKARELARTKSLEDEKKIAELYGEFENHFYNRVKSDPTAKKVLKGGVQG